MIAGRILYKSFYWRIFQSIISVLINISLVQLFQPEITAEFYSLIYLLSFTAFFTLGLDLGLNVFIARNEFTLGNANTISLILTVIALLISIPSLYFIYSPEKYSHFSTRQFLFYSCLQITGGLLTALYNAVFTARNQNYLSSIIFFASGCVILGSSVVVRLLLPYSTAIDTLFFIYFLISFLQGVALCIYSNKIHRTVKIFEPVKTYQIQKIIQYSFFAFVINFIFLLSMRVTLLLLPYWVPPSQTGNYIQAFKVMEYLTVIVGFIYYPFVTIASRYEEESKKLVLFLIRISNTLSLLFALFLVLSGGFLFPFIFGKEFDLMYRIFLFLIPGLFTACGSTFLTAYYFGAEKLKYNFRSALIAFFFVFASFFPFVKLWGILGIALSFSLGTCLSFLYDIIIFHRYCNYRLKDILLLQKSDIRKLMLLVRKR